MPEEKPIELEGIYSQELVDKFNMEIPQYLEWILDKHLMTHETLFHIENYVKDWNKKLLKSTYLLGLKAGKAKMDELLFQLGVTQEEADVLLKDFES